MKARLCLSITLVCAAAALAACNPSSEPRATSASSEESGLGPSKMAASDGTEIPESVYLYYVQNVLKKAPDSLTDQERAAVIDNLAALQLLSDAAKDQGLPDERTIAVQLELQEQQFLARAMIARYIEQHPATDSEIQAEYQERLPSLKAPQYKASHILVKTEDEAKSVIAELKKGANFAELAKKRSTDPSASNGGDLGWFSAATTVKSFADAVAAMKVGTYSEEPVQTQFGWHVILLEDRKEDEAPTLDSVREEIKNAANQKKVEAYIASLKKAKGSDSAKTDAN